MSCEKLRVSKNSSMWQISREMTAKGLLPRKRWKYDPPQGCPRLEECREQLKKAGREGGQNMTLVWRGPLKGLNILWELGQEVVAPMSAEQFAEHEQWEKGIGVGKDEEQSEDRAGGVRGGERVHIREEMKLKSK